MSAIEKHLKEIKKFDRMARAANELAIADRTTRISENYKTLTGKTITCTNLMREYKTSGEEEERDSRWQRFLNLWFPISFTDERAGDVYVRQMIEIDYWRHSLNRFARRRDFDEIQEENQILYSRLRVAYRTCQLEEVGAILSQITTNDYEMKRLAEKQCEEMPKRNVRAAGSYAMKAAVIDLSRWRKSA